MGNKPLELLKKRQQELAGEVQDLVARLQEIKRVEAEMVSRLNGVSIAITELDNIIKQLDKPKAIKPHGDKK